MDIKRIRARYADVLMERYTDPRYGAHQTQIWALNLFIKDSYFKMPLTTNNYETLCKVGQDERLNPDQIDWLSKEFLC